MTEAMAIEHGGSGEFDLETEMKEIGREILAIVPPATETKPLSHVEVPLGEAVRVVLANRLNPDPYQSDMIVSRLIVAPGQKLQRETFRWSSHFPGSKAFQYYENAGGGKAGSPDKKGFDKPEVERLRELITAAGESERSHG